MNTIGPGLLVAALAAPLVLLAACLSRKLRRRALALLWFPTLTALAAALIVMGGAPLAFDQPALRVSLSLNTAGAMLLAGGYVSRVLAPALASGIDPLKAPAQRSREAVALALALFATLLGFAPPVFFELLQIGRGAAIGGLQ